MRLYAQSLGWLHSTPKGATKSRLETLGEQGEEVIASKLPNLSEHAADYLGVLFTDAGLMSSNGMGPVPLSWTDIYHWTESLSIPLSTWEKRMIKSMSNSYVAEYLASRDATTRAAPYLGDESPEAKDNLADRIKAFYSGLAIKK